MTPGEADRLAALLGGADLHTARATLARSAGPELSRLACVVLQHRSAAEAAAAAALAASLRRAETTGWQPTGTELSTQLVADTLAAALRGYDRTREVDPLAEARPTALPADPLARGVVVAVLVAGLPVRAAAQAARIGEGRARRIIGNAIAAAGSEDRLREAVAGQTGAVSFSVAPREIIDADTAASVQRRVRRPAGPALVAFAALGLALLVLGTPGANPAADLPTGSPRAAQPVKGAPLAPAEAGTLPTLTTCGIGPPDARLAFAGWITLDDLGAAPPDAVAGQPFYALVPSDDVAWNPPGLSRRVMPPVRGRLACLSTVTGAAPTVVGLPAEWEPPADTRFRAPTLDDCGIRPADAPLAHGGWLLAQHLGERPASRPLYALVTADRVSWNDERQGRFACVVGPDGGAARTIAVRDAWGPPSLVDRCPESPLRRFAGNLELGGPDAFVLLPPVSTSWWANDPSVRIMARLSPGPLADSIVTATIRPIGPGRGQSMRVVYTAAPTDHEPSETHYVWLEGFVFTEPGCWVVSLAIDGVEVGWAVLPAHSRTS